MRAAVDVKFVASQPTSTCARKTRWRPSGVQKITLERMFKDNMLPEPHTVHAVAEELALAPKQVRIWFQNQRQRRRKFAAGRLTPQSLPSSTSSDVETPSPWQASAAAPSLARVSKPCTRFIASEGSSLLIHGSSACTTANVSCQAAPGAASISAEEHDLLVDIRMCDEVLYELCRYLLQAPDVLDSLSINM